jgi:hypothetical protein
MNTQRVEGFTLVLILVVVGLAAGAASFTHVHDWTMAHSPTGTPGWFGWANACISELVPVAAPLDIRRRRRTSQPVAYPMCLLVAGICLSLPAQLAVAKPSPRAGCYPPCRPWHSWRSPSSCSPAPQHRRRPIPRSLNHRRRWRAPPGPPSRSFLPLTHRPPATASRSRGTTRETAMFHRPVRPTLAGTVVFHLERDPPCRVEQHRFGPTRRPASQETAPRR